MYDNSNIGFLKEHEGSYQFERLEGARQGVAMKVIDRTFEDLVKRTAEFAKTVIFYDDSAKAAGDWTDFFKKVYDYDTGRVLSDRIKMMVETSSVDPHLALLFAFYRMLLLGQEDINSLTDRQMQFYFRDVLGFEKKGHTEGKVTVFVNLKKDSGTVVIPKGTLFDAGKDANGKRITYASTDEVMVGNNETSAIAHFDNEQGLVPVQREPDLAGAGVAAGKGAGTASGSGPLAANSATPGSQQSGPAEHAFCVSSAMLNQPGVKMEFYLEGADNDTLGALASLRPEYTGGSGWVKLDVNRSRPLSAREMDRIGFGSSVIWSIQPNSEPIAPYNPDIHGGVMDFKDPVIRFVSETGLAPLSTIKINSIKSLKIRVTDARNFKLMNAAGEVENRAGNNPFGPNYRVGDSFWLDMPFPADRVSINYRFKDSLTVYSSQLNNPVEKLSKWTCTLMDERSDQIKLTNAYSNAVLEWMSKNYSSYQAFANAKSKGLAAIIPILAAPVTISSAVYNDTQIKTSIQYPYGSSGTDGLEFPTDAIRILDGQSSCYVGLSGLTGASGASNISRASNASSASGVVSAKSGGDIILSLYVKMADKTYLEPGNVSWAYMAGNNWKPFGSGSVLKDTTVGLSRSGIVMLAISRDIFQANGNMQQDYRWIRAIADNSNALKIADLIPGALELEYYAGSEGSGPLGKALPAGSITKTVNDISGIKSVTQPFDGQAGRIAETEDSFNCRVSEHLRHKNRAWTAWDYEHLVLERFAEVAYVKCLNAYGKNKAGVPGAVSLIVVPSTSADELKPIPDNVLRNNIAEYIRAHCSPFVKVNVSGPQYIEIKVTVSVHLRDGFFDTAGYEARINDALCEFLKTWTGTPGEKGNFRNGAGKSEVIAFLEGLPYVDYIDGINLNAGEASEDEDEIYVTRPGELLTSAPSHVVNCYIAETHNL